MSFVYETMYIIRPDFNEERVDQTIQKYQDILREQGVEHIETQHRGKRRLAYEIDRYREGIYVQMNYEPPATSGCIAVLERAMRIGEEVIRYLTVKQPLLEEDPETESEEVSAPV